ncbi:hypothetical protein WJX84_003080 [Apatococcus fuscideae]|uniref:U-box domain-containing protein n=1 Tax=Apatococcus fuscideae TaxID=2026836 RepID=A0AAW1TH84_9CHLO
MLPDGHTFELSAIQEWLKTHPTSPLTGRPVGDCPLIPNWAIKKVVEDWLLTSEDQLQAWRLSSANPETGQKALGGLPNSYLRVHPLHSILQLLESWDLEQQSTGIAALELLLQDRPNMIQHGSREDAELVSNLIPLLIQALKSKDRAMQSSTLHAPQLRRLWSENLYALSLKVSKITGS